MSYRFTFNPLERSTKIEKIVLLLRFVLRSSRVKTPWSKYEYVKPWLAGLVPATVADIGVNQGHFLNLTSRLSPVGDIIGIEPHAALAESVGTLYLGNPWARAESSAVAAENPSIALLVTVNDKNSSIHQLTEVFRDARKADGVLRTETGGAPVA